MLNLYDVNGLVFWNEEQIMRRTQIADTIFLTLRNALLAANRSWSFLRTESPILTPTDRISPNYTSEDAYFLDDFVLRPETTPGSYALAALYIRNGVTPPPICVWQLGKSFRREQDQSSVHMRLKEFYQLEFQCIYTSDTQVDYRARILPALEKCVGRVTNLPTHVIPSDRLASYSERTDDIEVRTKHKWLEVCSVSTRTDFPVQAAFQTKKGAVHKDLKVLEVAFGLDRLVYAGEHDA